LRVMSNGAQRASRRNRPGRTLALLASIIALIGLIALPATASAASLKVVIVVGPVEGMTSTYRADANLLANVATAHGATVTKIYSPNATWSRVKLAAQHANILIYLGHGNGTPSPYPYSTLTKNGMGLNASANHGNSNVKYYGSAYMKYIHLAPDAVVILNHLCYSAGNSEPGRPAPTAKVAKQRIDYYASGMMKTGAVAVFAEPKGSAGYILTGLFTTTKTLRQIFLDQGAAPTTFNSTRVPGATATAKLTVRALTTFPGTTAAQVRAATP
jgi:hypothetical protein